MIPIEERIIDLETDVVQVATWLGYRFPEIEGLQLIALVRESDIQRRSVEAHLSSSERGEIFEGLAFEEARRCLSLCDWDVAWNDTDDVLIVIKASPQNNMNSHVWIDAMMLFENGDPVFGPD